MTVAIGLVCKDGVLVAADSMGSEVSIATVSRKVRPFAKAPCIWTASGSVYVMEEAIPELHKLDSNGPDSSPLSCLTAPDLGALRNQLKNAIHKSMKTAYASALSATPLPAGLVPPAFATTFLMLGYAQGTPWFLEFAPDGQINWHTESGYYATGSGGPFATVALGLMQHYVKSELSLEDGKLLAFRTIQTTIEVSSGGVGPPVQIAVCDDSGPRVLGDAEMNAVADSVERWKTLESDSLTMLRTGQLISNAADPLPTLDEQTAGPGI